MSHKGSPVHRVVIYARCSTAGQKLRQTPEAQVALCRALAESRGATVLGVFIDDAVSGAVELSVRPSAARMLRLCGTGAVDAIVVARLDRLARRLELLDGLFTSRPIEIWSLAEGTHDGKAVGVKAASAFAFAQQELEVINERLSRGRDHAVSNGRWASGPVPFGYDLDDAGRLTPSNRIVGDMTEADLARSVFVAMTQGSSTIAEARRLQQLGAIPGRRYSHRVVIAESGRWRPSRVNAMLRNTIYKGLHVFDSRFGGVRVNVPSLVDETIWQAAQERLALNRGTATPPRRYLLRGLVFCGLCGCRFGGTRASSGEWVGYYYRCAGELGVMFPDPSERCRAKHLPAEWTESLVRRLCAERDPSIALMSDFDQVRAAVTRLVQRIVVHTIRPGREGEATVVIHFTDGGVATAAITRLPRTSRAN